MVPAATDGLYDPSFEHDACGVAFVVESTAAQPRRRGQGSALGHLEHRGAAGADPDTGDGAGILLQVPDASSARSVDSTCRRRLLRPAWRSSCRPARRRRSPRIERSPPARGSSSSAGARSRSTTDAAAAGPLR